MRLLTRVLALILLVCLPAACSGVSAEDGTLPAVQLTVDPDEFRLVLESSHHTYQAEGGSLRIDIPKGWHGEFGEAESVDSLPLAYIRGRGNSTWLNQKKPFKFRLQNGADLLGMGSNKHWVLLAEAIDGSLLRNRLMSYTGRAFGLDFTPKMIPVELYINGAYQGYYVLSQQIRKGKTRVNIGDDDYLLSMNPWEDEAEENIITTSRGVRFLCEDPVFFSEDPTDPAGSPVQKEEIASILQQSEDAIFSVNGTETSGLPGFGYKDLRSAAKYWWIEEFFMNGDGAFTPSTYLYTDGGKLYWGPLWDFDLSIPTSASPEGLSTVRMPWFDHLRAFSPYFRKILADEWGNLCPILMEIARDGGVIDGWVDEILPAWERNAAAGFADESIEQDALTDQAGRIKDWFLRRIEWINSNLDSALAEAWVEIYFYADDQYITTARITIPAGCLAGQDFPDAPEKDGFHFSGWVTEDGAFISEGIQPETDLVVHAVYTPAE